MSGHTLDISPETARSYDVKTLYDWLYATFVAKYDFSDENELDIWQKTAQLIKIAADQALRNRVYDEQKKDGPVTYSVKGALQRLGLENVDLGDIKSALIAKAIITLTRHPTTVFPDETYQASSQIMEAVHNLAMDIAKGNDNYDSILSLHTAMEEFAVASTEFVHGKKHPTDEGKEEREQLKNIYHGLGKVTAAILEEINTVKNVERRAELLTFVRDELAPIMMAVWGSGPDQDNNLNAKTEHAEDFYVHARADLKELYGKDLKTIYSLLPADEKPAFQMLTLPFFAANDNGPDETPAKKLEAIAAGLKSLHERQSENKELEKSIIGFLVKTRCFKSHFAHLDFRQDTEITSALCDEMFGAPSVGADRTAWLNEQFEKIKAPADREAFLSAAEESLNKKVDSKVDMPQSGQMLETLRSLRLIQKFPDSVRQYTLAQFKTPAHWLEMELLLRTAGVGNVGIVPLAEDEQSLLNFGKTLRALKDQPVFQEKFAALLHMTVMQAKSDPTRESGAFIAGAQMEMMIGYADFACDMVLNGALSDEQLAKALGGLFAFYVGGSLDNNRAMFNPAQVQHDLFRAIAYVAQKRGLSDDEIKKLGDSFEAAFQYTIQGRDGNYCFGNPQSAADTIAKSWASCVHFKRGLQNLVGFVRGTENANVVESLDNFIASCAERRKSYQGFFGNLLNQQKQLIPNYIRKLANISSRKAGRKGDDLTEARAIDLQGFYHGAGLYLNEWLGAENDKPQDARKRFIECPEERKQAISTLVGLYRTDLDGARLVAMGDETQEAIIDSLRQPYQQAKINTLYAIGMAEAGYTHDQIENWDFVKDGLPFEHILDDELKLLTDHARAMRRKMAEEMKNNGIGTDEKPNERLLKLYRTVFEASATPTSVSINGAISGIFKLTSEMAKNPGAVFAFAA